MHYLGHTNQKKKNRKNKKQKQKQKNKTQKLYVWNLNLHGDSVLYLTSLNKYSVLGAQSLPLGGGLTEAEAVA